MPIESMVPRGMRIYGELCGWTLAWAHARAGDRIVDAVDSGRIAAEPTCRTRAPPP
jgi:hypothetical protein